MSLWEDAEREKRQQETVEAANREHARAVAERNKATGLARSVAVREFITAMRKLGIPPQKHKWRHGDGRNRLFGGVIGWWVENPRQTAPATRESSSLVVTRDAEVFGMTHKKPLDLADPLLFTSAGYGERAPSLQEQLRDSLTKAMRG